MVAGMYLGELARVVLEDLTRKGVLFGGDFEAISQPGIFPTKYISEIERYDRFFRLCWKCKIFGRKLSIIPYLLFYTGSL